MSECPRISVYELQSDLGPDWIARFCIPKRNSKNEPVGWELLPVEFYGFTRPEVEAKAREFWAEGQAKIAAKIDRAAKARAARQNQAPA